MPEYHWRTFPVYFAFAVGGFIGLYVGIIVQATGNSMAATIAFVAFALMLGFGLSRLMVRFMVTHQWVKPRPRKR